MSVEMIPCKLNGQFDIILPKHRADRPEWYAEEGWEKKRLELMHDKIKKDNVVFYVGAEEGDMCGLVAKWGGKVVMFEPNDKVMPNIKVIWEANNLPEPLFFAGFASDRTTDNWADGLHGLEDITGEVIGNHGFRELKDPDTIHQVKIDDFIDNVKIAPQVITLDVEGSEGRVLRGAEKTLREYHPTIFLSLHPEFMHEQYGEWGAELRRWLIELGYEETLIDYPLHEVHLMYEAI